MHRFAVLMIIAACRYDAEFPCTQDSECRFGEALSRCEKAGFCSLADDECISGRRYDVTASSELAETCVPGPEGCELWMPRYFDACRILAPSGNFAVSARLTLDTTTGILTDSTNNVIPQPTFVIDQGGTPALVLSVQDFTVATGSILFVEGDRPLIIAAWGMANVEGSVMAGSSSFFGARGPGADLAPCTAVAPTAGADGSTSGGGGGGGGGGFAGAGGRGGSGGTGTTAAGGTAGAAIAMPMIVHGGCSGAASGKAGSGFTAPATASSFAAGGRGGGAVAIAARLAVTIIGTIHAGGEGGAGAPNGSKSGGGGGGSGGLIALDSARITLRGTLIASGGGGGGSAPTTAGGDGGSDANVSGATGGVASACSPVGGAGSTAIDATGNDGLAGTCGGSGGGGGAGYIFAFTPLLDVAGSMQNPSVIKDPF